jgi:Glycosyltransferase family 87
VTTPAALTTSRTALPGGRRSPKLRAPHLISARFRPVLLIVTAWLATRIPLYLTDRGTWVPSYGHMSTSDITLYQMWVQRYLVHGNIPNGVTWQYPPLVGSLLLLPKLMPGAVYLTQFVTLAFLADAAIFGILVWTALRRGSWLGPWFWVLGGALLGPIIYGRFDVFATFFPVAALALLGTGVPASGGGRMLGGRRRAAGALIGLGTALKFWPGMALFGLPRTKRGLQTALAAVIVGGGATVASALFFNGGTGFLGEQGARGIEIESLWALPFLFAHWAGAHSIRYQLLYGSLQVVRPGLSNVAADLALLSTALGFAVLGWWWWRKAWRPAVAADAAFVGTLISIVTSRVISPQYMIWLLGTAAFCLLFKDTTQRRSALLFLLTLPLTQLDFPITFAALGEGQLSPILIVGLRDALLLAAAVIGMRDLWRSTVTGRFWSLRSLRWHPEEAQAADRARAEDGTDDRAGDGTDDGAEPGAETIEEFLSPIRS